MHGRVVHAGTGHHVRVAHGSRTWTLGAHWVAHAMVGVGVVGAIGGGVAGGGRGSVAAVNATHHGHGGGGLAPRALCLTAYWGADALSDCCHW